MREVYTEMESSKVQSKSFNGIYRDIADLLGMDAALKFHEQYRGQQITLPVNLFNREYIASQIIDEYNGHNAKYLASKFGYSEKWIRKIIKNNK